MATVMSVKPKRHRSRRVLLVEDDPVLALALEGALLDAGAGEVIICPSMTAAMSALEQKSPFAVILDVHLADRDDGWALAELIDQLGPRRPRIAFSTGSPGDIPDGVRQMGAVFEKPYDPDHLAKILLGKVTRTGLIARLRGALAR